MSSAKEVFAVGSLIDAYFRSIGQLDKLKYAMAADLWPKIVGQRIAGHTKPSRCEKGFILVEVDSASWQNELHFIKREIVAQLNQALGGTYIKDIKFIAAKG